jgi:23S rRNA pseudouridine955/2504/2580 synthase
MQERRTLPRTFLHAAALEFRHPRGSELISLQAPLPEDLESFLKLVAEKGR